MAIFDSIAGEYDNWYQTKLGAFVDYTETKLAFSMINICPGMKILDVGCGTGNFSIKLAEMGCAVVGVDLSEDMLAIARHKTEKTGYNITFSNMNVYCLDFPDNSFDAVFSMAAFEFIKEPKQAYTEMYRVLKPNGQLLIGTIHKESSWGQLYLESAANDDSIFNHASFKTHKDLQELDHNNLVQSGECLFLPPHVLEENINEETDKKFAATEHGGYICYLWMKH